MMTLKLALLATTAAGAVAAAGGITYATVGNSSDAPSATSAKDAGAGQDVRRPAPVPTHSVPTCLPKLPKGKQQPHTDAKHSLPSTLPKAGETGNLPKAGDVPQTGNLPKAGDLPQTGNLPKAGDLPKTGNLPTCAPDALPKKAPVQAPSLPGKPNLPAPGAPSCSSVPPAINLQGGRAKDVTLPNGMHLAFAHGHSIVVRSQQICANTEKFVAAGGNFLTVERLNAPPQVTLQELAQGLKLPQGNVASVSGVDTWESPLNAGMLWYEKGYALYLTGSPAYTPMLPGIASQLRAQ